MNTSQIRSHTEVIDILRAELKTVEAAKNIVLATNCGQECANLTVCGVSFSLSALNRCYMPEAIKGMERMQAECAAILDARIATKRSLIADAEWKLRQLCISTVEAA